MRYEKSDEPIVAMKVRPMTYRTCTAGYRERLYEDKTRPSKGVLIWIELRQKHDKTNRIAKYQEGKPPKRVGENATWQQIVKRGRTIA